MTKRAFVSGLDIAINPQRALPRWASFGVRWAANADGFYVVGSALAHVNRRYHWHMGRLWFLLRAVSILSQRHRDACERIIRAEMRDIEAEFTAWKKANEHA